MKLKIIYLFFAYLKSSKNIYDDLLGIVKQKIETKDYYLIDLEKKYYVFKACFYAKGIVFGGYMRGASGSDNNFLKVDVSEYNKADEIIQAICDFYLSENLNISKKSEIFYKIRFASVFDHDIRLKLENFFYSRFEPDFFARLYDSNKQKQIRELCLCFSRSRMIDIDFCFSKKIAFEDTIQCFEEENKMKIFFPVKLRNLVLFF
ncbi:hypothetical protein NCER_102483 [Vairimorpha ceranae BRL01]|uniref:Uncharacterized protein n=1 Tax=Vairimorpha ceranae (strain BRL01) TaxID=578460 RepID=C4VC33_VAIC1|nr:hypothetical protein NCER_102483 [Vairimorpha ceranae BRL01]